jgi:rhodanese-related sulfurtransferase
MINLIWKFLSLIHLVMPIENITPQDLKALVATNSVVIIDVREPSEYAQSSIPNAILIPVGSITAADVKKHQVVGKKTVIHCRSGVRSLTACNKILKEDKSLKLYNLLGGIAAYQA